MASASVVQSTHALECLAGMSALVMCHKNKQWSFTIRHWYQLHKKHTKGVDSLAFLKFCIIYFTCIIYWKQILKLNKLGGEITARKLLSNTSFKFIIQKTDRSSVNCNIPFKSASKQQNVQSMLLKLFNHYKVTLKNTVSAWPIILTK